MRGVWSSACKKSDFHKRAIHESPLRSRIDITVNFAAALFRPIFLKPCRDRRPRRSEKKKRLLCVWLHTNSRLKSKICCFSGRRKAIAAAPYRQKFKPHRYADTERNPYRSRGVEFSLRLVSQGDLPSANSRSDTTPWCHSLRLRRFATSPPTGKKFKSHQHVYRARNIVVFLQGRDSPSEKFL